MAKKSSPVKPVVQGLEKAYGRIEELDEERPLEQLILLILARGADVKRARAAMKRLQSEYVDWNDVRVTSVYEVQKQISGPGMRDTAEKATQLKELLSTVYNRFNKLNLDFLHSAGPDADKAKKRERFSGWLQEKSSALAVMMSLHGPKRAEIVVSPALVRVLQRLGWIGPKSAAAKQVRDGLQTAVGDDRLVSIQWCLYGLADEFCIPRTPRCEECPVVGHCSTGVATVRPAKPVKKAARKATKKKTTRKASRASAGGAAKKATKKKATRKPARKKATTRKKTARKKTTRSRPTRR